MKICCFTGHRTIPPEAIASVTDRLTQAVHSAITQGYTHFISGFAAGTDLLFAEIVVQMKSQFPVFLEAAIPYPSRMKTQDETFRRLILCCDLVGVHSPAYSSVCYKVRNQYMVDGASLVIAVHDGRQTGGTAATVRYARAAHKQIWIVAV